MRVAARSILAASFFLIMSMSGFAQQDLASQIAGLNHRLTVRPRVSASQPAADTSDLFSILKTRQQLVEQLIRSNPSALRSVMLPSELADQLRSESPAYAAAIETTGEWTGELEATVADDFKTGHSQTYWTLHSGDTRIEVWSQSEQKLRSHLHLPVTVTGVGTARVVSAESIRSQTDVAAAPAPLNCTTDGQENVAVIFMNQPSGPSYPVGMNSSTYWQQKYFGANAKSANNYWQESSFAVTSATGNFYGPFTLGAGLDCTNTDALASDAIAKAIAGGVDFSTYSRVSIIYPVNTCGFGGLGTLGCRSADAQINHPYSVTWIPVFGYYDTSYDLWGLVAHELGHNLGLAHSSSLDFGTVPLGALDYNPVRSGAGSSTTGVKTEYGDPYTVMGGGSNLCGGQYTAFNKSQYLTWMMAVAMLRK